MNPLTPTAYIPVPISQNPEKEGWYNRINENIENAQALPAYFKNGKWYENKLRATENINSNPSYMANMAWLRPVDLSRMLEEAWEAGGLRRQQEIWHQTYDPNGKPEAPDLETYLISVLNAPK